MNQVPIHTCGYIDGVVLIIDGFTYALVEDGIVPLESKFVTDKLKPLPLVLFGGQWYHFREKGTLVCGSNDVESNLRRYLHNERRNLQNGVKTLDNLITAFIEGKAGVFAHEHVLRDPGLEKGAKRDSRNVIKGEEVEKKLKKGKSASSELQSTLDEVMPEEKVMQILKKASRTYEICVALFGVPKIDLKGKNLRYCHRSTTFWWAVVDIALSIASTKLLNWAFSTCRLWKEKFGKYSVLPGIDDEEWYNEASESHGIFNRFICWKGTGTRNNKDALDENNFGDLIPTKGVYYREENILPVLECLFRIKEHSDEAGEAFEVAPKLENLFERVWPCSAIEYILPLIEGAGILGTAIPERCISKFAMASADRLIFAIKKFRYLPLISNVMERLSPTSSTISSFKIHALPIVKVLASLTTPGWCKIFYDENSDCNTSHRNKSGTTSKAPVLVFEDTVHLYDPKSLKPAPPIFDFEMLSSPWAESFLFSVLKFVHRFQDPTQVISVLKQIVGCGGNLRIPNLKGKLPYVKLSLVPSPNAEFISWMKKQDAFTPAYSTILITKDTSSAKRKLPSVNLPEPPPSKEYQLPEPICCDSLKYALIAGDIAKAKKEFENGAQIRVAVDGKHQTYAYWELMYEIVRQGRLESLKLLHERGFPLKDVLLRRHLFPTRNINYQSYGYNENDDTWPYEDAGDIHYRLIIEACKVGNLEMVRFLREVAKSSWSSSCAPELHYPTFWYTIRMDEVLSKARKEETNSEEILSGSISSPASSIEPSATSSSSNMSLSSSSAIINSSSIGLTPAMDYFESQLLAHNMSDPMTDMPFSIFAAVNGSLNALKWMKSRGWNIREDKYRGAPIVHYAFAAGHFEIVMWLALNVTSPLGALTRQDRYGMTALNWALARKMQKIRSFTKFLSRALLRVLGGQESDLGLFETEMFIESLTGSTRIPLKAIEWCGVPPKRLMPPVLAETPSMCYSTYDLHDKMVVDMGLRDVNPFGKLEPGNLKKIKIAKAYEHLRRPIEDFLTYRDKVMVNMDEADHNIKRVRRLAKQEKSFAARHAKSPIPSCYVVSDFVRRISVQSNFEVDFWLAWGDTAYSEMQHIQNQFQNFLLLSQFAGVDMISASVDAYKREWLDFEPCVDGAVAPLLEIVGVDPDWNSEVWQNPRFPGVRRRQTSIFAVVARAAPWNGRTSHWLCKDEAEFQGWGAYESYPDDPEPGVVHDFDHEHNLESIESSPLIWMFTVLLPTARRVVAIVSEVFIEVALLGSIPMLEWLIDNCDVGDKTMDCYRMMMCQVAVFGTLNTLKWLHHRGFPLSFAPDDSGLRVEESCRFKTSEYMPVVPDVVLLDFQERSMIHEKPIIVISQSEGLPKIKLSRRPNFINATIALYPCYNFVRQNLDVYFCERIDFLVRNGVSLFEADPRPDGDGWDASDYIHAYGYSFLVDHLKNGPFKADVSYKREDKK